MHPCNPHLSENIKYFHHPITFLDDSKSNSTPSKTSLLGVLSQTASLDYLWKRHWAPTMHSVYIDNCFPASCITDAKPHQAQMQNISMAMPTWEQARRNWIIQPQHLASFLCLAFKTAFSFSNSLLAGIAEEQKAGWFQSQQEFSPWCMYIFHRIHTETQSYLVSCVYVVHKTESYRVWGTPNPQLQRLGLPHITV